METVQWPTWKPGDKKVGVSFSYVDRLKRFEPETFALFGDLQERKIVYSKDKRYSYELRSSRWGWTVTRRELPTSGNNAAAAPTIVPPAPDTVVVDKTQVLQSINDNLCKIVELLESLKQ